MLEPDAGAVAARAACEIRAARAADEVDIATVINDAARAYHGVIAADCWHEPYMSALELQQEIADGVKFWLAHDGATLLGVMGLQDRGEVALIRHAYVRTTAQRAGIGSALLRHVLALTTQPLLIGTWTGAHWAIAFYRQHDFEVVAPAVKEQLLQRYWSVPARQVEMSVVLADARWRALERAAALR